MGRLDRLISNLVVVDISRSEVIDAYAEVYATSRRNGRSIGDNDLWIAAAAHVTGTILLTADKDFLPLAPKFIELVRIDPNTGKVV